MSGMAQVAINTDASSPDGSAVLDLKSSTKGLLPPRMTDAQIHAIYSPAAGLIVFCTDCNNGSGCLKVYNDAWRCFFAENQPVIQIESGTLREYYPVNAASYTWLDRNLGASRVATSSTDYQAYGSLYQWGRKSDGHQCINWTSSTTGTPVNGTTTTQCSNGTCANGLFVSNTFDWNTPYSEILWDGTRGTNDPCPSGYRVPSQAELTALNNSFNFLNSAGAFHSNLKMPVAGERRTNGTFVLTGLFGIYWSSSNVTGAGVNVLSFGSSSSDIEYQNHYHALGYSVRCIEN
jgi:uncharacterized protein (TIGR02145 family)